MDFRFTPDQIDLRDGIRAFLEGEHGPETLRRLDAAGGRDPDLHRKLVEMGLTGLLVPEAQGGMGLGLVEAALVGVELGRANVSEPIVDSGFVAAPLLAGDPAMQAAIASGEAVVALQHPQNPWVADLDRATHLLSGDRLRAAPAVVQPMESVDPLRRLFRPDGERLPNDRMRDLAALAATAQMIGGAERMRDLATDYAKLREQFGQPIGGFQAVKHLLATASVRIAFAEPLLWRAAWTLQQGDARAPFHVAQAKVAATDAAILAGETAIQVHGAMGYTYEVDLHFWMKRSWALAGAWGDRAFHLARIDDAVIGGAIAIGPDQSFESEMENA